MIPENVKRILDRNGLEALEFAPGSTPTSVLAAERLGVTVGQIAKSLLFRGRDGGFFMIVCAGDSKVSSGKLKRLTGVKTRMATPEETFEITGFKPGGVCPFGISGIPIYVDASLSAYTTIYPAAGNDASGVPVSYDTLIGITGASECDVTGPAESG